MIFPLLIITLVFVVVVVVVVLWFESKVKKNDPKQLPHLRKFGEGRATCHGPNDYGYSNDYDVATSEIIQVPPAALKKKGNPDKKNPGSHWKSFCLPPNLSAKAQTMLFVSTSLIAPPVLNSRNAPGCRHPNFSIMSLSTILVHKWFTLFIRICFNKSNELFEFWFKSYQKVANLSVSDSIWKNGYNSTSQNRSPSLEKTYIRTSKAFDLRGASCCSAAACSARRPPSRNPPWSLGVVKKICCYDHQRIHGGKKKTEQFPKYKQKDKVFNSL